MQAVAWGVAVALLVAACSSGADGSGDPVDSSPPSGPVATPAGDSDDEDTEDTEAEGVFPYRLFTFDGTEWTESLTDGIDRLQRTLLLGVDGAAALVRSSSGGTGLFELAVVRQYNDGQRPVLGLRPDAAVGVDGSILVSNTARRNPFPGPSLPGAPNAPTERSMVVAVSSPTREDAIDECIPAAGGTCELGRFEFVDGFPDLAGSDFSGADLSFAELGEGDYSGASFAGSVLIGASTDFRTLILGADFSGATLAGAELGDAGGANFASTDLTDADITFSSLPEFAGARLVDATLRFDEQPDDGFEDVVFSLPGVDLTDTTISGPVLDDEPLLMIGDFRGTCDRSAPPEG